MNTEDPRGRREDRCERIATPSRRRSGPPRRSAERVFWAKDEPERYRRFLDLQRAGVGKFRLMRTRLARGGASAPVISHEARGALGDRGAIRRR